MDGLFCSRSAEVEPWHDFGRSEYFSRKSPTRWLDASAPAREVRRAVRTQCPLAPAVYGMLDPRGQLIYVGMSARLRDRLLTYFTDSQGEAKQQRIAAHADRVAWEASRHPLLAELRELELICRWRPRFNARGRPGRYELGYIYLTGGAAPCFHAAARLPATCRYHWGPLALTRRTRAAVRRLNQVFRLRDCPARTSMRFADQRLLFPHAEVPGCLRAQLETCLAPCGGTTSQQDYTAGIRAARALLDGHDNQVLDHYRQAMQDAAAQQQFERAAYCRDVWQQLALLQERLALINRAQREYWFVYPVADNRRKTWWILLAGGQVVHVVAEPKSGPAAARCLQLLHAAYDGPSAQQRPDSCGQLRIVASWFRRHPQQLETTLSPEQAIETCHRRL